jgi:hypothetical protein
MFSKLIRKFISWLYRALEEEKARIKQQAETLIIAARDERQQRQAQHLLELQAKSWERCKHLKGGKVAGPGKDYAVWYHTFPDGSKSIQCLICGKPWNPQSPDWETALDMFKHSSNTATSCEFNPTKKDREAPLPVTTELQSAIELAVGNREKERFKPGVYDPFVSDSYVERVWNKLYKKLTRKKKLDKTKKS